MPHQPPDPGLRRLIVQLARLREDDLAAILETLEASDRAQIMALMGEYKSGETLAKPAPRLGYDITRLSPWLSERLETVNAGAMTPHASQAILACAAKLFPLSVSEPAKAPPKRRSVFRPFFGAQRNGQ